MSYTERFSLICQAKNGLCVVYGLTPKSPRGWGKIQMCYQILGQKILCSLHQRRYCAVLKVKSIYTVKITKLFLDSLQMNFEDITSKIH